MLLSIHEYSVYMSRILGRVRHHLPRYYTPAVSRFSVFSTMSAPQPNSEPASETYKPRYIDVFYPPWLYFDDIILSESADA